jgi:hypothetical protein
MMRKMASAFTDCLTPSRWGDDKTFN